MGLNKLDNFIKNVEGRTLYVNPNDLDATDSITNTGNSLTQPFKTIQRALLEAARFSFVNGKNNDLVEKTTILVFPGEHLIDNRPGFAIYDNGGAAYTVPPTGGIGSPAQGVLSLELDSNFDLTQEDNILYKFNSINGGVVVPRGTSIIGLDLRKTKLRPKYVPNPTDDLVAKSAIFRVTGACYFWQFSFFDGDESGLVYTHPSFFTSNYQSTPRFSHHKLTCFEYADGVNEVGTYGLTDLDMYYSKLSNAFNSYRPIPTTAKYPTSDEDFAKRNPEWQIVGAFASDPIEISTIFSGNGTTASTQVTVTTAESHNLNVGTPIKIKGVSALEYNISSVVQSVISDNQFTYLLETFPITLPASPSASGATVTVETDTVSGASPYIFNCSLRSVWGMNGMHADGSKASGFRSMVVAQFTAVSLQKDDRAFVKYDKQTRTYNGVIYNTVYGGDLPTGASQTDTTKIYHLDPNAIYRHGWETSHIKVSNDAFIQIVSVFAIGFNKHFDLESGADASITNSNSNFGQISLNSDGYKAAAFSKDNNAFITSIITPRDISPVEENIEWLSIDVGLTTSVGITTHLYLFGLNASDSIPVSVTQGYRIGARVNDKLYLSIGSTEYSANIYMQDGVTSSVKLYDVTSVASSILTIGSHTLQTGEKIIINSESGDLPENVTPHIIYYAIRVNSTQIKLATSFTNALNNEALTLYGGSELKVYSRVSDKTSGDIGSPIQFNSSVGNWYLTVNSANQIYNQLNTLGVAELGETTDLTYVKRVVDERSLDERVYKIRAVIPKELSAAKDPEEGFIIQDSSTTNARPNDFTRTSIASTDYEYNKNPRFITTCSVTSNTITVLSELPHDLNIGDIVIVKNVTDSNNLTATDDRGYNGRFRVTSVSDDMTFSYSTTDMSGRVHNPGSTSTNNIDLRVTDEQVRNLPRFERNDIQQNLYIYRNEVISPYVEGQQDGIYHLYVLNASNRIPEEFVNLKYSQSPVNLYPQLDRDNVNPNPPAAKTFALRAPIGDTNTNDLKKSITRETIDKFATSLGIGQSITSTSTTPTNATLTFGRRHGLGGIAIGAITAGASYNNGTYYDVKLLNTNADPLVGTWKGATAKVVVSGGVVTSVDIISSGSGYTNGEALFFDNTRIGSGDGNARYTLSTAGISTSVGNVVQITGIGTTADSYHRISAINSTTQISIAKTAGDPNPTIGQYAIVVGPAAGITTTSYSSVTGIATFTTATPHGLLAGNKFRIIDSSNNNVGDYVVRERVGITTFTATTNKSLSVVNGFVLKHALSANDSISDIREENFGVRQASFYGNEVVRLSSAISDDSAATTLQVSSITTGIGTAARFPMGSYIQIDSEVMRIISSSNNSQFTVIRGALGTRKETHDAGSLIRKINPLPVEFRRPSILRASGHTFEYLGYGPGNYSTGLPQVQVKSLSDREDFLVQAQERSGGIVVYTGMNNNGDFFSGNTKTSSSSGEITSYDIPTPTVTGEEPSKSSVVYDEVTVKERLLVEGGDSGIILSQFDGPVTFNKQIRAKDTVTFSGQVRIVNSTSSDSVGKGALTVRGGVGIGENLNVGGNTVFTGIVDMNNLLDVDNLRLDGNVLSATNTNGSITLTPNGTGIVNVSSDLRISGNDIQASDGNTNITLTSNTLTTFAGDIRVNGNDIQSSTGAAAISLSGTDVTTANNLIVTNDLRINGNDIQSSTGAAAISLSGTDVTTANNLIVTNDLRINGNDIQASDGNTNITLTSNTLTTFAGDIRVNGNDIQASDGNNNISLTSNTLTTFAGDIRVNGNDIQSSTGSIAITLSGANATVAGTLNVNGNTTLGDSNSDITTVNGELRVTQDIIAFYTSDRRLKDNITPISDSLTKVLSISGNTFDWNEKSTREGHDVGLIAQEVNEILPEAVTERDNGYLAVDYQKLVPLLVEAIKELSSKVEHLEQQLQDK